MTSLNPLSRWTVVTEAINVFIKCAKREPLAMPEAFLRLMFVPHYYPRAALVHFLSSLGSYLLPFVYLIEIISRS